MGRLDLTVEYVAAFEPRFRVLFTREERLAARRRHDDYMSRESQASRIGTSRARALWAARRAVRRG